MHFSIFCDKSKRQVAPNAQVLLQFTAAACSLSSLDVVATSVVLLGISMLRFWQYESRQTISLGQFSSLEQAVVPERMKFSQLQCDLIYYDTVTLFEKICQKCGGEFDNSANPFENSSLIRNV